MIDTKEFNLQFARNINLGKHYKVGQLIDEIDLLRVELSLLAQAIKEGSDADPGHSDLDNEQPIHVSITLGDYRRAVRLYYELRKE